MTGGPAMLSTQSLREQLNRYADGSLSSESLEEWLASESWDMRRWAPRGLQHLVEALQVAFIDYSDRQISAEQLQQFLLQRRDQLHRAHEVTKKLEAARASRAGFIQYAREPKASIAGSQALMVQSELVSA
jgi:hypothetical protein